MNEMVLQTNNADEVAARIQLCRERREESLDLSGLDLTEFPNELKAMTRLNSLNLRENCLTSLPEFIGSYEDLEYLDVSFNKLSSLPEQIGNLMFLEKLNVRCNELNSITESIGNLAMLRSLDLSYNRLSYLPETLNNLPLLEYCNTRGNGLKTLPEIVIKLSQQKNYNLLGHIERIVELTGYSDLSDELNPVTKVHIEQIVQKLHITPIQAILFSHIVHKFDDSPVRIDDLSDSLNCSRIKLMQYQNDFLELERRKLVRSCNDSYRSLNSNSIIPNYSIPKDVFQSILKDEEFHPVDQTNLSVDEFFVRIHSIFEERSEDHQIGYDDMLALIIELLNDNRELIFVKKILAYGLTKTNIVILLLFCHHYVNIEHQELELCEIERIFDRHSKFTSDRRQFKSGEHILLSRNLIENANRGGFGDREAFKMTNETVDNLLADLKIKTTHNSKDIIHANKIQEKLLFYNEKETKQIKQLLLLLGIDSLKTIEARLSENNLRTGFACLFYGPTGVGKTETVYQLARQTGRDIMMLDISQTKSMWFGESEKKIKAIFTRYREYVKESDVTPILLINEADALIGKRKNVDSSSVAQTENTIQNIILQEMEDLKGILIATTNLTGNMDNAFERRFLYKIDLKKPTLAIRQLIWKSMIPVLSDEDSKAIASRYDFSGGQIENISRKRTVEYVLSGKEPSIERLISFCDDEILNKETEKRIGFGI